MSMQTNFMAKCESCGYPILKGRISCSHCGAATPMNEHTEFNPICIRSDNLKDINWLYNNAIKLENIFLGNVRIEGHYGTLDGFLSLTSELRDVKDSWGWSTETKRCIKPGVKLYLMCFDDIYRFIFEHDGNIGKIEIDWNRVKELKRYDEEERNRRWHEAEKSREALRRQELQQKAMKKEDYERRLKEWESLSFWKRKRTHRPIEE